MIDLSVKIGHLVLRNPVIMASGTFGYGDELASFINLNRLGGIVTKAITLNPRDGNPPPRIVETAAGMLNAIGLANIGVERFIREKLPFLNTLETAVIVNVAGNSIEEYVEVVERLDSEGKVDAYELNVSCPNVKEGGLAFGTNPQLTYELTSQVRKVTTKTILVKLTPNVTRVSEVAQAAEAAGADAVSLINTVLGMAVDVQTRRPKLANITGGLSGPAIKPIALAKVYEVHNAVNIPIVGIGGIMGCNDVLEFLITGASAVQIGTANFINPLIGEEIVRDLEIYGKKTGIKRLADLVASLVVHE